MLGFGHLNNYCKQTPIYKLYKDKHAIIQHVCSTYSTKSTKYTYLVLKYANYKEVYTADFKVYESLLVIKTKETTIIQFY